MLVWNGAPDSPPASGVRDYLLRQKAGRLVTVVHPLQREDDPSHRMTVYEARRARLGAERFRCPPGRRSPIRSTR